MRLKLRTYGTSASSSCVVGFLWQPRDASCAFGPLPLSHDRLQWGPRGGARACSMQHAACSMQHAARGPLKINIALLRLAGPLSQGASHSTNYLVSPQDRGGRAGHHAARGILCIPWGHARSKGQHASSIDQMRIVLLAARASPGLCTDCPLTSSRLQRSFTYI